MMSKMVVFLGILLLSNYGYAEPAKKCKDFKTQAAAQKYHDQRKGEGNKGWKSLDRDGDGRACDCNSGGSGKNCPTKK